MDRTQDSDFARQTRRVSDTSEVEEGFGKKFLFENPEGGAPHEILLCRVAGKLHALHTLCPHAGGRLAEGPLMEGRYAHCPLHLYKFDPETGASIAIECDPATVYQVEEHGREATIRPLPGRNV